MVNKRKSIILLSAILIGFLTLSFGIYLKKHNGTLALPIAESFKYEKVDILSVNNSLTNGHDYSAINHQLEQFVNKWDLVGATFCIAHEGRIIYARGFGMANKEEGLAMQPYHTMRVASVSKLITAVAVMKLVEEGKLRLNDRVFGPDGILNDKKFLSYKDKRVEEITVHNLLNHSGGWTPRWGDHLFIKDVIARELGKDLPLDVDDYIVFALSKRLHFQPGSHSSYSNIGFVILQRVIEKASGNDYERFVKNEIFKPLNIYDARLANNWDSLRYDNEVRYYEVPEAEKVVSFDGSKQSVLKSRGGNDVRVLGAAGGWVISPISLTRFVMAVDGRDDFPDILSKQSVDTMKETYNRKFQPLGWRWVKEDGTLWRSGSMAGTSALVISRPDGYTLTFISNQSHWKGARFPYVVDRFFQRIFYKYIKAVPHQNLLGVEKDKY
jgi:CubicO group peptidase (beta-lactamase class C family)